MANNKHLTLDERITIETMLNQKASITLIANALNKHPTTISKEIRNRLIFKRIGAMNRNYNACANRFKCTRYGLCSPCHSVRKYSLCKRCSMCNTFCKDFIRQDCPALSKPPYVCNGCGKRMDCTLEKRFYYAKDADMEYRQVLSDSRNGISLSEDELQHLDDIVSPLIKQQQSPHHICVSNQDSIMVSERTIYRLIDARLLSSMNIDLPRKVRYRPRKKTVHKKVDRTCRIGRDYDCFLSYRAEHPDFPVTQLDSVEGKRGKKVLLTIHFLKAEMMLAFIRDHNDSKSVIDIFNNLYEILGHSNFQKIFRICLADNGSEFSNPNAIEKDSDGNFRTKLFYCNPNAPYQKGSAERNHEFIRYFIPKGTDMSCFTQKDICLMMDHINSYCRESLGDKSPYEMFAFLYGQEVLDLLGCHLISPQNVTLNRSIWSKEGGHES